MSPGNEKLTLGKLHQTLDETVVEWTIRDFFNLPGKSGKFYNSPNFTFSDACWSLWLYPYGRTEECKDHVALYLLLKGKHEYTITCCLKVKEVKGIEISFTDEIRRHRGNGYRKFCRYSELKEKESSLFPPGILTFQCTLKREGQRLIGASLSERLMTLSYDFQDILVDERQCDVVLKFVNCEMKAHKLILEKRCKYFEAMFSHDMLENRTGVIWIDDVEPDIFATILKFIYCGKVGELSHKNVYHLYVAADKYQLDELKRLCTTYMEENLSVKLFCDVLQVAGTYEETELMRLARDFFSENSISIFNSENWKRFRKSSTAIALDLTTSFIEENVNKLKGTSLNSP